MSENFGKYYEQPENRNNETISVFDDAKYTKQKEGFYNKIKNNPNHVNSLKDFIGKQNQDKQKLGEYIKNLEKETHNETRENLDKEIFKNEIKIFLYEKLGIDNEQQNNSSIENFIKGVIDGGILDNYDLLLQIYETNGKIILDGLSELASWEGINKLVEAIGEDINTLWEGNTYEKGKVSAEVVLGLLTAGIGVTTNIAKKGVKIGIKNVRKLRKPSERVVESAQTKNIIGETRKEIDDIVPKKELDFEEKTKTSLDIKRQIEGLKELGIPESFSKDILESGLTTGLFGKKFDLLERYKLFNNRLVDYEKMIKKTQEKIPNLTKEEALLIFSYTDYFLYGKLNSYLRGNKKIINSMTKENIKATNKIIIDLENALEKMPNLEHGKDKFILRGDGWDGWISDKPVIIDAFTSVSNNKKDILLGGDNKYLIKIKGKDGRIKDISSLALYVNFSKELRRTKTNTEGILMPKSEIIYLSKKEEFHIIYDKKGNKNNELITEVEVKQIK